MVPGLRLALCHQRLPSSSLDVAAYRNVFSIDDHWSYPVQPAMHAVRMETVPMTRSHVKKLQVTEMKMCRWASGHRIRDHVTVRNDNIKERLNVESITERCMKARLRWFGHVKRRDQEYVGRKTLEMVPPGRGKTGRPKQRWMYCVNQYMRAIGTTKDEIHTQNWLEENCVCRSVHTKRLEEEGLNRSILSCSHRTTPGPSRICFIC